MRDCVFCKIVAGEIPSKAVYSDEEMHAFHDINPVAPVHVLIIPKKHIASVDELTIEDASIVGRMVAKGKELATELGLTNGYRLVINNGIDGGQEVQHLHIHLIGGRNMQWPPG